jgi:hypothetical protein
MLLMRWLNEVQCENTNHSRHHPCINTLASIELGTGALYHGKTHPSSAVTWSTTRRAKQKIDIYMKWAVLSLFLQYSILLHHEQNAA